MLYRRVNDHDMAYIELGQGSLLVCIHGSLSDFRVWSPVLGPLSRHHRVIAPSLRRYFPEHWDGAGGGFTVAQHVADVIAFLKALGGKANLLGHSRGGHVAFRVAQQRPDLLKALVLAEPGGDLDESLAPEGAKSPSAIHAVIAAAAARIAAGDVEDGLMSFIEGVDGPGVWQNLPAAARQELQDNARTLLGQPYERRLPFTRSDVEAIGVPTLLIGGASSPASLLTMLHTLARHMPNARTKIIPDTGHMMFRQAPAQFSALVTEFLRGKA